MNIKHKKVLVYGLGKSGIGAIKLLKKHKTKIYYYDDNFKEEYFDDVPRLDFSKENIKNLDYIVVNPSISKYCENLVTAQIMNIKIISEVELAFLLSKGKIISVTGSNGKSTTVSLISHILSSANVKNELVGNIGTSFCEKVAQKNKNNFVVEISSFQLETTSKYHSNIACFLNFTENHLDRHFSLKEYFETKLKIFNNQSKKDFAILNYDDEKVRGIKPKANTYFFSKVTQVKGTFVEDENIIFCDNKKFEKILPVRDIKLVGKHNLENILCAVLVCKLFGIENEYIKEGVSSFYGINHRIEYVDNIEGIDFYNDSKSTTVKATQTALDCFAKKKILLILGGSSKNIDYNPLFNSLPSSVKEILAIGDIKFELEKCARENNFFSITICDNFKQAVKISLSKAREKNLDLVLLSPATASFDEFKNFEERGDNFKKLVEALKNE